MSMPRNAIEVFALIGCITTMYVGVRLLVKLLYRLLYGPLPTNRNDVG